MVSGSKNKKFFAVVATLWSVVIAALLAACSTVSRSPNITEIDPATSSGIDSPSPEKLENESGAKTTSFPSAHIDPSLSGNQAATHFALGQAYPLRVFALGGQ